MKSFLPITNDASYLMGRWILGVFAMIGKVKTMCQIRYAVKTTLLGAPFSSLSLSLFLFEKRVNLLKRTKRVSTLKMCKRRE